MPSPEMIFPTAWVPGMRMGTETGKNRHDRSRVFPSESLTLAETTGVYRISRMNGIGRRMPWTMGAFTVAAFGMIGVPPVAGFVSKWFLGLGALQAGASWVLWILGASSLLNAAYFLPILSRAWFCPPAEEWDAPRGFFETDWRLLLPALTTAGFSLLAGVAAASGASPLSLVDLIVSKAYRLWELF